jgi:cbb3-type cytochrome oxidase maturation protein
MESLYLLIPLSIGIVFVALWLYFKAADNGQFDDLVGPGMRILQDDDTTPQAELDARAATAAPPAGPPKA